MGLFSKDAELDPSIDTKIIGSDPADRRKIAKAQDALLGALQPNEQLVWVAADIGSGSVMALTTDRIMWLNGKTLEYVLDGSRVAATSLGQTQFYGDRKHAFKHSMKVTWAGGPLKHQSIRNFESPNMFLFIERWEYDEANQMCNIVDRQFGLA